MRDKRQYQTGSRASKVIPSSFCSSSPRIRRLDSETSLILRRPGSSLGGSLSRSSWARAQEKLTRKALLLRSQQEPVRTGSKSEA